MLIGYFKAGFNVPVISEIANHVGKTLVKFDYGYEVSVGLRSIRIPFKITLPSSG